MTLQITETIAAKVRGVSAEKRVKSTDLADAIGISKMSLSRRLRGETSFTAEQLLAIATRLEVPINVLYGELLPGLAEGREAS